MTGLRNQPQGGHIQTITAGCAHPAAARLSSFSERFLLAKFGKFT